MFIRVCASSYLLFELILHWIASVKSWLVPELSVLEFWFLDRAVWKI